ncbi:hypothetical protein [Sphingobacterium deserti]|uniref:Uncharacterized protein n=1 Tax=Sphingobacterium deserti TaxID=1229276 RepID=A0A0B8T3B7_9SPHI|nr:hypothetical protein [Sphingobacterium deserti]KGE15571.1 hypothetical protein DI53_0675 [Sphingobacterium deserti]
MIHKKIILGTVLAISFLAMYGCQQPANNQARPETATPTVEDERASGSAVTDSTEVVQDSTSQ